MPQAIRLHITTLPGRGQEQIDAYGRLAPLVRAERGCLQYDLHRFVGGPDRFVLTELRSSSEALAANAAGPTFRAGPARVIEVEAEPVAWADEGGRRPPARRLISPG
ncbi:antibiotic biosynthesis monooxygenase family protein [Kitasatospora sp. NPDC048722]|uniref:putative quinol monooxygenase n=1 Tax=Kitasatospora sp. NPDC048722 TaxID=3155639 RepID=UPI0033F5A51F